MVMSPIRLALVLNCIVHCKRTCEALSGLLPERCLYQGGCSSIQDLATGWTSEFLGFVFRWWFVKRCVSSLSTETHSGSDVF